MDVARSNVGKDGIVCRLDDGDAADTLRQAQWFADRLFPALPPGYVGSRLPLLIDPLLLVAEQDGAPVGFKLAYRIAPTILFSWLGGVLPDMRHHGIAGVLMTQQHKLARELGYAFVETRTRTANNAMIMLNLRHGFEIAGVEADAYERLVVIQRKALAER